MKPSFALDLSPDGISLLHRTIRGWLLVGEVALDDPDLGGALGYLRATALGLEPRGLNTKLILPPDQILYTTVTAPGPSRPKRRARIAAALEGLTPYPVEDLVYDWSGTGPEVQVAVVARETLDEAEAFAVEHRFNPVSFVTVPEDGAFDGEPFFGATRAADERLPKGEKVLRDPEAVHIVGRAVLPRKADADLPGALAAPATAPVDPSPAAPEAPRTSSPDSVPAPAATPDGQADAASDPAGTEVPDDSATPPAPGATTADGSDGLKDDAAAAAPEAAAAEVATAAQAASVPSASTAEAPPVPEEISSARHDPAADPVPEAENVAAAVPEPAAAPPLVLADKNP